MTDLPTIRVYVAGPLYGSGTSGANIHAALGVAERLRAAQMWPFVPHLYHQWEIMHPHPEAYWLDMDRIWLETCDAMVRIAGKSPGSSLEERWCAELGIPVYHEGEGARGVSALVSAYSAGDVQPRGTHVRVTVPEDPLALRASLRASQAQGSGRVGGAHVAHQGDPRRA